MDTIEIRLAADEDIPDLAGLITELGYPTSPAQLAARLERMRDRADFAALVATEDGTVVGMAGLIISLSFMTDTPDGRIIAMIVSGTHRGGGIGRALLTRAEAWFAERGVTRISLTSGLHRPRAHDFYRACNYQHTGLRFARTIG